MSRSAVVTFTLAAAVALFAPAAAHAQQTQYQCNLGMVMSCSNGQCTSTTTNNGSNACSGTVLTGFISQATTVTFSNFSSGISLAGGECFDSTTFPTQPGQQVNFALCIGTGSIPGNASFTSNASTNAAPSDTVYGVTEVIDENAGTLLGLAYAVSSAPAVTCTPSVSVASSTLTGVPYTVSWSGVSDPNAQFIVDESTAADFSTIVSTQTTSAMSLQFHHDVTATTTYYYRVRTTTCGGQPGTYSPTASIVIQGPPPPASGGKTTDVIVPFGTTDPFLIPVSVQLPPSQAGYTYAATTDKPTVYFVSPSSGTVPAGGLVNLTITANPANLPAGAFTGTLLLTVNPPPTATGIRPLASTTVTVPVSVSLVTPVTSGGKSLPPTNALIIPNVGHLVGKGNTPFVSDVRLTNGSAAAINYQVTYTPANTNGTTTAKITTVTVAPGQTIALNDIAKDFFGVGATASAADTGSGALEIRPTNSASLATYASSRTYASTSSGTYGQFIAATPFSQFATSLSLIPPIGAPPPPANTTLSLQQVSQSSDPSVGYRTNLGLVEGSGTPATGTINVYDDNGDLVKSAPLNLGPGQQTQVSLANLGVTSLDDGRIEIKVTSPTGAVSGYASVLDNKTQDPLAVSPVAASSIHASHYVLPGMSEYVFSDGRNFHSDIRLFNGGTSAANVTLTLYETDPSGKPVAIPATPFTLLPGQIERLDNVLADYFKLGAGSNHGGAIVATTNGDSSLVVTGRTYSNAPTGGTFGQFIPGATPAQGIGAGDKPLQILQLESSQQFRTNIGVAEVTGNPVKARISLVLPDSKASAIYDVDLGPNQFAQVPVTAILGDPFANVNATAYNVRATIEVVPGTGSGKVTAYGSVIDKLSSDPTYVPAQ